MINVGLIENGSVMLECSHCEVEAVVPIAYAASPFWSVHVGDAVLVMLAHVQNDHSSKLPTIDVIP